MNELSQFSPGQLLEILSNPEATTEPLHGVVSVIDTILSRYTELTSEEQSGFRGLIEERYPSMTALVGNQAQKEWLFTTALCAVLLGDEDTIVNMGVLMIFYNENINFYRILYFLYDTGNQELAQRVIPTIWERSRYEFETGYLDPSQKNLLENFSRCAFKFGCDSVGYDMATLYEDEVIEPEDPRILKYRLVIRNPEELWLALDAIWEFFHAGATRVVSPELMDQAQQYIISELRYIDEHNVLHPSMIANLSKKGKKSKNHYNFKSYSGRNYYIILLHIINACLFGEVSSTEYLLKIMGVDSTSCDLIADIVAANPSMTGKYQPNIEDKNALIYDGCISPLLRVYRGPEYAEFHKKIYDYIARYGIGYGKTIIQTHQTATLSRMANLQRNQSIASVYHEFMIVVTEEIPLIIRMHILDDIESGVSCKLPKDSTICTTYYILEYYLLYGKWPTIDRESLIDISKLGFKCESEKVILDIGFGTNFSGSMPDTPGIQTSEV